MDLLVGGCDSTSNAIDKLFPDGADEFLPIFDFASIHYQGLDSFATFKQWTNRSGPNGRVKIWDTESWVANTDDRVAALVAANRAAGYDRAMGVFGGNIAEDNEQDIRTADGKTKRVHTVTAWSVAPAVGAAQHFIGERDFNRILFQNGLPWVFIFRGLPDNSGKINDEDGTVVVVGDIGEEFGADGLPFRTARGFAEKRHKAELKAQLAALPATASCETKSGINGGPFQTGNTQRGVSNLARVRQSVPVVRFLRQSGTRQTRQNHSSIGRARLSSCAAMARPAHSRN